MSDKDIEIDVEDDVLTLRGGKRTGREEERTDGGRWHLVERSHGAFQRAFTLPRSVDPASIEAQFENGVLTIHLPKRQESKGRRISIGAK